MPPGTIGMSEMRTLFSRLHSKANSSQSKHLGPSLCLPMLGSTCFAPPSLSTDVEPSHLRGHLGQSRPRLVPSAWHGHGTIGSERAGRDTLPHL